jgi:hypothetical protein
VVGAAKEFEEFLLHHDPEKVLTARGQRQKEPYGTEKGPAVQSELEQRGTVADGDVLGTNQAKESSNL